jgi:WD40 repeat protein
VVRVLPGWQWAAFTPDGKQVLAVQDDSSLGVYELATGRPIRRLAGHSKPVVQFDISRDGRRVLTSSNDGTIRLWDLVKACELDRTTITTDGGSRAVFSPDGKWAASRVADRVVRLWDLRADHLQEVRSWPMPPGEKPYSMRFTGEGRQLVVVSATAVHWFEADADKSVRNLKLEGIDMEDPIWQSLSADADRLVVTTKADKTAHILELPSGKELAHFTVPVELSPPSRNYQMFGMPTLSPEGRHLLVPVWGGKDHINRVYLYPLPGGK